MARWLPDRLALVELLTDQFPSLEQSGARVGIGVATGHDAVFAPRVTPDIEPSRLLPMVMSKDLRGDRLDWSGTHLVNPWESNGVLVDLAAYPKLAAYFAANESAIRDRFVAKARPDSWHRTIDKVEHNLVAVPKLLIPDMKTALRPVLEPGGLYPHHNLYHVTAGVRWDIEVRNWSGVGG